MSHRSLAATGLVAGHGATLIAQAFEDDVLDELLQGQSNRAIGRNLFISEDTVKSHVKAILRKLGARDRAHAVSLVLSSRNPVCSCGAHGTVRTEEPTEVPTEIPAEI